MSGPVPNLCPDCRAALKPEAKRCKCGWRKPAEPKAKPAPVAPRPAVLDLPPPRPPTEAERRRAAAALAAIRATIRRLTADWRRPRFRAPTTEVERILDCTHPRYGDPESAKRYGAGGYVRRCLECGRLDFVFLTPEQREILEIDRARVPQSPPLPAISELEPEPGSAG